MTVHANGKFDVKLTPIGTDGNSDNSNIGKLSIDKQFHGDLDATSKGVMLAVRTEVDGSAGYVALERVTGKLGDRAGSFVLQHTGTMDRGAPTLSVTVVPDSGTDELVGLAGRMQINIADGNHFYEFDYTLE